MSKKFLKSVPSSLRWLIRPALFVALGLHGLLLLAPVPKRVDLSTVEVDELPQETPEARESPASPPAASPSPLATPTPRPAAAVPKPTLSVPLITARPTLPKPAPRPLVRPAARTVPPVRPTPSPSPVAKASPSPSPPSPSPAAFVPPTVPSPDPVPPPAIPFGDVPLLAGAETGCLGLGTCHSIADGTGFRTVGQSLEAQFESQGYQVKQRDDLAETGHTIYEISKDGKTRYLNVFSAELGETVYLVTPQIVNLTELKNSEGYKTELEGILDSFPVTAANSTQFAQPEAFFTGVTPRAETGGRLRLVANNPPSPLWTTLRSQLESTGFGVAEAGGYGSGLLYEVTKGAFTGYLNLVPTADRTGTIVVLWSSPPQ